MSPLVSDKAPRNLLFIRWVRLTIWSLGILLSLLIASALGFIFFVWISAPRSVSGGIQMSLPLGGEKNAEPALRLLAVGDTGTGGEEQLAVAAAMEAACKSAARQKKPFSAMLMLGDNFYPSGVKSISDAQWQEKFEIPYGTPCLAALPVYPVLGNHDYRWSPQAQIDYSAMSPRWRMPGRFYSVDFGPLARLIALDTNRFDWCGLWRQCTFDFLKYQAVSASGRWRIAVGHHPMAGSSSHGRSYDGTLFKHTVRPYVCKEVDFYLAGHSHQMEHLNFDGCRTEFLIAGTGGADLGRLKSERPGSRFVESRHGFLTLDLRNDVATIKFNDTDGGVIYQFDRQRKS